VKYRMLGRSGLELSEISFGTWATLGDGVSDKTAVSLLNTAYEAGVNHFDTSETYGDGSAELALGAAIAELAWPRETFVVTTKVYYGVHGGRPNTWGLGRKHIREGCDASLRRLKLAYLDLLLCHRLDDRVPLEEIVCAMGHLVDQGKTLYWGTSEWPVDRIREAMDIAQSLGVPLPVTEQLHYSLLWRKSVEQVYRDLLSETGIGLMVWSPLEYGLLAGRYDRDGPSGGRLFRSDMAWLREQALGADPPRILGRARAINDVARSRGLAPAHQALAWVLRHPRVSTAICGASTIEQLHQTLDTSQHHVLDDDALRDLETLTRS
jgi:voltage-dependent potassium channel beta subunit